MIRDRSQELGTFHARHIAEPIGARSTDANEHHSELADEEVVRLARDARNAAKFEALWQGDISGYASHSEADQALQLQSMSGSIPSGRDLAKNPYDGKSRRGGKKRVGTYGSANKALVQGGRPQLFQKKNRRRPWK